MWQTGRFPTKRNMRFTLKWGCKEATNGSSSVYRWQPSRMLADLWPGLCLASWNTVNWLPITLPLTAIPRGFTDPDVLDTCFVPVFAAGEKNSPCLWPGCVPELQFGLNCPRWIVFPEKGDLRFVRCQARVTGHSQLSIPPPCGEKAGSQTYISANTVLWLHSLLIWQPHNNQKKTSYPAFAAACLVVLLPWERVRKY